MLQRKTYAILHKTKQEEEQQQKVNCWFWRIFSCLLIECVSIVRGDDDVTVCQRGEG